MLSIQNQWCFELCNWTCRWTFHKWFRARALWSLHKIQFEVVFPWDCPCWPQCWYNAFFNIIMLSNTHNKPYYLYRCQKIYAICVQTLKRSNPILKSFKESIQKLRFATTLTGSKQFNFDLLEDWFLTYFDLFPNFNIDIGLQSSVGKHSQY